MMPSMGFFAIPAYINPKGGSMIPVIGVIVSAVVAFIVGFILQLIFGKKSVDAEYNKKQAQRLLKQLTKQQKLLIIQLLLQVKMKKN